MGTGPFVLREFDRTNQMVLEKNERYRLERYPSLPVPDPADAPAVAHYRAMQAAGMLADAGTTERQARKGIDELKAGIEKAAESVLGDEAESLRRASQELRNLTERVQQEKATETPCRAIR